MTLLNLLDTRIGKLALIAAAVAIAIIAFGAPAVTEGSRRDPDRRDFGSVLARIPRRVRPVHRLAERLEPLLLTAAEPSATP